MKKTLLITSLLGVFLLAGCGSKTATSIDTTSTGATVQTFDASGFRVTYPLTWTMQQNAYWAQVIFFSPQWSGDLFRENVGIVSETLPSDMSIATYYTSVKNQISTIIQNYQEISNEDLSLNGVAAKKIVYVGTQNTYQLKWMQVLAIKNKTAYIINYTASADTFDEFSKEANAIVDSFVLK